MQPTLLLSREPISREPILNAPAALLEGAVQAAPEGDFRAIPSKDITCILDSPSTERIGDPLDLEPGLRALEFKQLRLGSAQADRLKGLERTGGPLAVGLVKNKVERAAKVVVDQARKSLGWKPGLLDRHRLIIRKAESIDAVAPRIRRDLKGLRKLVVGWLFYRSEHPSSGAQTVVLQLFGEASDSTQIAGDLWTLDKSATAPAYNLGHQAPVLKANQGMPECHAGDAKVQSELSLGWQTIAALELSTRDSLQQQEFDLLVGRNR